MQKDNGVFAADRFLDRSVNCEEFSILFSYAKPVCTYIAGTC